MSELRAQTKSTPFRGRIEDELDWFFGYAEGARRRERVVMLPSHVTARTSTRHARRRAEQLAQQVEECLIALPAPHTVVLRAVFTPRRWPKPVQEAFRHLSPVAVRLYGTTAPWPGRTSHQGLEEAVALQLAACLRQDAARAASLRLDAEQLFEAAMDAYAQQRREVPHAAR